MRSRCVSLQGASLLIFAGRHRTLTLPEENTSEEEAEGAQHKKATQMKKRRDNLTLIRCDWKWKHEEVGELYCMDRLSSIPIIFACGVVFIYSHLKRTRHFAHHNNYLQEECAETVSQPVFSLRTTMLRHLF